MKPPSVLRSVTNAPSGNFLIGFLTPFANDGISYAFGFVFFGCNLAAAAIVYFFMYETKSLSLEHVDAMYQLPKMKAWQSKNWTPPGYLDRKTRDNEYWQRRESVVDEPGSNGVAARENEKMEHPSKYDSSPEGTLA